MKDTNSTFIRIKFSVQSYASHVDSSVSL
jgi:hypothetical protein